MRVVVETVTIDCDQPAIVADFWRELLDLEVVPHPTESIRLARDGALPHLLFTPAGRSAVGKNPWHFDLRPQDRAATVARALALGASHAEIGQRGDESWVVLLDPEGNEFCILQSRDDLARWEAAQESHP